MYVYVLFTRNAAIMSDNKEINHKKLKASGTKIVKVTTLVGTFRRWTPGRNIYWKY